MRFELTWRGLFGIAVLVFCLFLWMFILGIWAGQTILSVSDAAQPGGTFSGGTFSLMEYHDRNYTD